MFIVEIDLANNGSWVALCGGKAFAEDAALAEALEAEESGEIVRIVEVG